ncbi:testis-specific serine/threonine-protein kinase 2-like [Brevipalpus obovatus]|uniref:testis-specific serine/threonine-protein kinase 2-like n=1 Tax=Brevipalpus obovatus TaxID=246614 RepID=UPI003D9EF86B
MAEEKRKTKQTDRPGGLNLATEIFKTRPGEKPEDIISRKNFKLMEKLGAGAFATVFKTLNMKTNKVVACKVIEIKRKRKERITDLKNELYVLEKVDHPNVVKMYEHFVVDDKVYIFMEYAAGGTLSEYVRKKGPIRERKARDWFMEIASAIKHLHQLSISHRDLKLGNILLDSNDHCKVTDFGLSRISYKPNKGVLYCTSCCGTEPYMAPEILKKRSDGTRLYDPMVADIWALGVCLYAMVNKAYPFNPEDKELMISNQLHRKWKFVRKQRSKLSPEVKDIVRHMLEPNPRKRITMLGIMSHPWLRDPDFRPDDSDSSSTRTKTETTTTREAKTLPRPKRGEESSSPSKDKKIRKKSEEIFDVERKGSVQLAPDEDPMEKIDSKKDLSKGEEFQDRKSDENIQMKEKIRDPIGLKKAKKTEKTDEKDKMKSPVNLKDASKPTPVKPQQSDDSNKKSDLDK